MSSRGPSNGSSSSGTTAGESVAPPPPPPLLQAFLDQTRTDMGEEVDLLVQSLAMDLVVGAAAALATHWTLRFALAPMGTQPLEGFCALLGHLDAARVTPGCLDLRLYGDHRDDGSTSFVLSLFPVEWGLAVTYERLWAMGAHAVLDALQELIRRPGAFALASQSHTHGCLHLSHFKGAPALAHFFVGDYYVLLATHAFVHLLRACPFHQPGAGDGREDVLRTHRELHLGLAQHFYELAGARLEEGREPKLAAGYAAVADAFRALALEATDAAFARLLDILAGLLQTYRAGFARHAAVLRAGLRAHYAPTLARARRQRALALPHGLPWHPPLSPPLGHLPLH